MSSVTRLLAREPQNDRIRYLLAHLYIRLGRVQDGLDLLHPINDAHRTDRSVVTNTSVNIAQYSDLAWQATVANDLACLIAQYQPHRLNQAHKIARDALRLAPANPALLDTLGWIEHLQGNHATALRLLNRAVVLANSVPQIHQHLAATYQALPNPIWAQYHQHPSE
ncbi:MAG: tetratricopeptide repeat protein [Planctomycetes bacterium]|nr:tetratricopeptide repeat protein [Planctomycetota bacterium]